ncbi:hypothetical protein HNV08_04210 [Winogradskyella eckloniae]|uniref:hypothetical protein n=1 Tax=Winogradskyella eckloniae TaxID=1089306 RepID=UPI0015649A7A|nr:hypothetical protein [Winogradskyella eckloniae]NRD19241.1 hypothetical protein [Winogradskyella eckloniae]
MILVLVLALCFHCVNAQVGVGTTDPKSTLDINGNLSIKVVSLNGGPMGSATPVDDGVYLNLTPTTGNEEFILPNATLVPGRIYILRNVSDSESAVIYSYGYVAGLGNGVEFYSGDSRASTKSVTMTADTAADGNDETKTLIFISDGSNWTYGQLGF